MCALQALDKTAGITLSKLGEKLTDKWLSVVRMQFRLHGRLNLRLTGLRRASSTGITKCRIFAKDVAFQQVSSLHPCR
jgi:hypothetical protein